MAAADVDINYSHIPQDPSARDPNSNSRTLPRDELDDLFDYVSRPGDIARAVENDVVAAPRMTGTANDLSYNADLGIDEEVKVRKARKPIAKLDEDRYVSHNKYQTHHKTDLCSCQIVVGERDLKTSTHNQRANKVSWKGSRSQSVAYIKNHFMLTKSQVF